MAAALVALLAGCRAPERTEPEVRLRVFAAASLAEVLDELSAAYAVERPGVGIVANTAGTQQLRAQIEAGAAVDVLLSADVEHALALHRAGLVETPTALVANRLALGASPASPRVRSFADALAPGARLVRCAHEVPAGRYTDRALAGLRAAGRGDAAAALEANVVSLEENVAAAAGKAALGEADAAFVYATDVRNADLLDVPLPESMRVAAVYAKARAAAAPHADEADAFVAWLEGERAAAILAAAGFSAVQPGPVAVGEDR